MPTFLIKSILVEFSLATGFVYTHFPLERFRQCLHVHDVRFRAPNQIASNKERENIINQISK